MPTCAILLIIDMGSVLNVGFSTRSTVQNSLNMPYTEVIATYTYKIGIINGQYSYSTAIGPVQYLGQLRLPDHRERDRQARFRYEHFLGAAIMSATTTGAVAPKQERYSWNQAYVRQKKTPGRSGRRLRHRAASGVHRGRSALLWFVVIASFSDPNAVAGGEVTLLPQKRDLRRVCEGVRQPSHLAGLSRTIIYSVVGTAVNMARDHPLRLRAVPP